MLPEDEIIVVGDPPREFDELPGPRIRTGEELSQVYTEVVSGSRIWLANELEPFRGLGKGTGARGSQHRLLVVECRVPRPRLEYLRMYFRSVGILEGTDSDVIWLCENELAEVLSAEHRDEYVIGVTVDQADETVILHRGNLEPLAVPMDWFARRDTPEDPDFSDVRIADHGQTLEFGAHDVAVESVLYDFDPEVRRRLKDRRLEQDDSFGASLRRLRLHKGLAQSDFDPVTARQIRRIEKGETRAPRDHTLRVIAERLGVEPREIGTY